MVLCLVAYQNLIFGKIWVGDPFASVSTTTNVICGVLVVIAWYIESFWVLFESCMANGGEISTTQIVPIHEELVHADLLVIYLGLVACISSVALYCNLRV